MIKDKTNMLTWTMKTDSPLPDDGINSGGNPQVPSDRQRHGCEKSRCLTHRRLSQRWTSSCQKLPLTFKRRSLNFQRMHVRIRDGGDVYLKVSSNRKCRANLNNHQCASQIGSQSIKKVFEDLRIKIANVGFEKAAFPWSWALPRRTKRNGTRRKCRFKLW